MADDSTKRKIMLAASELFVKKGYDRTSIRDITDFAKSNISSVNYHFGSKENLFKEIVTSFARENIGFADRILRDPQNFQDVETRLELFIGSFLDFLFQNYCQTILVLNEVDFSKSEMQEAFEIFQETRKSLTSFFSSAQKKKIIKKSIEPDFISTMLLNHLSAQMRNEEIVKQYLNQSLGNEKYRRTWIKLTIEVLLKGCSY